MLHPDKNSLKVALSSFIRDYYSLPSEAQSQIAILGFLLARHGLFDRDYYLGRYEDVLASGINPDEHYAEFGYKEYREPGAWLEEAFSPRVKSLVKASGNVVEIMKRALFYILGRETDTPQLDIIRQGSWQALYDLPLYVHWSITAKCNYHCSYCSYFFSKAGLAIPDPGLADLLCAVDKLAAMQRPAYEFVLLGGEPTVSPHLPRLIAYMDEILGDRLKQIVLVSNGSRGPEYFNQFAPIGKRIYFQIMNSIHLETHTPEKIYNLIQRLDPDLELNLLLMAHPEKLDLVREIYSELCVLRNSLPFHLVIHPLYQLPEFTTPDPRYPEDFFSWRDEAQREFDQINVLAKARWNRTRTPFAELFWEIYDGLRSSLISSKDRISDSMRQLLNFKNMQCVSGAHLLRIEEDGNLLGTTCGLGNIGLNIYKDELEEDKLMQLIACPKNFCACSDNDLLPKFADKAEATRFLEMVKQKQRYLKKSRSS